jgi:AcrR family transcriptional regulator
VSGAKSTASSTDPRAVSSRRRLSDAFVELARAQGSAITVADLVARAGVHRSSFYAHFGSIGDLAAYAVGDQLGEVHEHNLQRHADGRISGVDSNRLVLREILRQVSAPPFALLALLNHDSALAEQAFGDVLRDRVLDYFARVSRYSALSVRRQQISAEYVGHALSSLVCAWLRGEVDLAEDDFVLLLGALVPQWVMSPDAGDMARRTD